MSFLDQDKKKLNHQVNLKVFDHHNSSYISLECQNIKYLDVLIDENLSWKYHITHIGSKISKTNGIIASLRHFVPLNTFHHIYISLIQLYLLYGIFAWDQAAKTYKSKIRILQKRALRLMFFGDYNSHAIPYFVSSSFLPLDLLYSKSVAILMHISNSLTLTSMSNFFASQSNIIRIIQGHLQGDYCVKHSRLDKQTKSFSSYGLKIWNSLLRQMHQMPKNTFKINVHENLLRILSENGYIDLPDLITKIS